MPVTVLLVEADPDTAQIVLDAFAGADTGGFRVEWVKRLSPALERLRRPGVDVVLLDLMLPDARGIDTFDRIFPAAAGAPVVVLSDAADVEMARMAVARGAGEFLGKGRSEADWLPLVLRHVVERSRVQGALRDSEARFRAISDASPLGIFVSDRAGECVYTNAAYHRITGLTFDQALGTKWTSAIHPEDRERVTTEWVAAARGGEPFRSESRFLRRDGIVVWTRMNSAPMLDGAAVRGHVQTVEDITDRKTVEWVLRTAEDALFQEKERAQVTLNSIGDAVVTTDLQCNVTYLNLVAEAMTGWQCQDALGRPLAEVFNIIEDKTRLTAENPARRAIAENRTVGLAANSVLISRSGVEAAIEDSAAPIHDRDGMVSGAVIVFHDVSDSRAMALKMSHQAQHDFLTGLANRALLTERLSQAIGLANRHRKQAGLLFIDLDYFKHINDSLGHAVGDMLLQSVAARLVACVRGTDTVCRQGGDEFVIVLAEIERPQDASHVAEKLIAALAEPHFIDGHDLHVTLSIGISIYPDDGRDVDTVMKNSDTAMYHAKACGRNNYQFFRKSMNTLAVERLDVEINLRRALKADEFLLHYQPQIDLASGSMTGCEALVRWLDPKQGLVQPGKFVAIAEECGLIVPIGRWVLGEACRQVQAWLAAGLVAVPVAVNISAVEFRHKDFVAGVAQILTRTGLDPGLLELELTEGVLMQDAESSVAVLEALKAMGVGIAIDDFGTGYSSLSYLKRFPIGTLKIDRSFVRDIVTDTDDATIVSAVIGMGQNLKQRVIAEGVETDGQLAFLRSRRCEAGQGFLFNRPLSADDFAGLLRAGVAGPFL